MKKLLIIIFCFFSSLSFSQGSQFELTEEQSQFPGYIVIESENLSIKQGYQSVLEWIHLTYDTPDKVIKSQVEDKYIRITGSWTNVRYDIEFKFQENRVKFDITGLEAYATPNKYSSGGWYNLSFDYEKGFKKNGKLKKGYWNRVNNMMVNFNNLSASLKKHLDNPNENFEEEEKW